MTIELLTLVALWCGNPLVGHSYNTDAQYMGPYVSVQAVNQCRVDLRACIKREIDKSGSFDAHVSWNVAADVCTAQIQHPGRDQQ